MERKVKKGEWERNWKEHFIFFPFLHFSAPFSPFWPKSRKTGENMAVNMWKEAAGPFLPFLDSRIWRDSVFYTVQNPFLTPFQSGFCPFPNPFLHLSNPVPRLSCTAFVISRYVPLAAQPLDHVRPSPLRGLVGGLYSWRGDARD